MNLIKKTIKIKFCNILIASGGSKILEFNHYEKSDKASFFIHAYLKKKRIEKIDVCKSHPENSSTAKEGEHTPLAFPMSTILSFKSVENKHDIYRGKDCMKKFCKSLRKHKKIDDKHVADKKYHKVRDHCHYTG